jgi:hypothetical protein
MAQTRRFPLAFVSLLMAIGTVVTTHGAHSTDPQVPAAAVGVEARPSDQPNPDRTLKLTVVSKADNSPLPEATVWVRTTGGKIHTWEGNTDDQGHYLVVPPSEATRGFDVMVACAGYVTSGVQGGAGLADYTMELEPAETIGGIVRDEQGQPIEGARVLATAYPFLASWPELYASRNSEGPIATTDGQGRWRSDSLPAKARPEARVRVLLTHSDHIMSELDTTASQARAFSSVQVMKTGLSVSGRVLSPFGRPVPGAMVTVGLRPWAGLGLRPWEGMYLRLTTNADGKFYTGRCLDPLHPKAIVIVQASGLGIGTREIQVTREPPPQVIRLTRRRPIEGRVVDIHGRPLAGAIVISSQSAFDGLLCWDAETDGNGQFVWYDAPTDVTILLSASKPPFIPRRARAIYPGARELIFTLHAP